MTDSVCKKIIVEGSNLSGKSSVVQELEKKYVHSVVLTFHGYYHPTFKESTRNGSGALTYHRSRLESFYSVFRNITSEEILSNRFHLTASVYLKLFYGIEEHFYDVEEVLNELDFFLVLVDFNDEALSKRLDLRIKTGKEDPYGDDGFSMVTEKRDLYRSYFKDSKVNKKIIIDNSNLTATEAVDELIKKL